jgi:hypothetical protein
MALIDQENKAMDVIHTDEILRRVTKLEEILERIARLEEKTIAAAKALDLASESITQRAALEGRVFFLEKTINFGKGEKSGQSISWGILVTVVSLALVFISLFMKALK